MLEEKDVGAVHRILCNTCGERTRHELKAVHSRTEYEIAGENTPDEDVYYWEETRYGFWICLGCDTATFMEAYSDLGVESTSPESAYRYKTLYPAREEGTLKEKHFVQLNPQLSTIYREVITSYNSGLDVLCSIGLRALLEGVCADKGITGGLLHNKIDGLEQFLPINIVQNLHSFRFMGNEAAHELKPPRKNDLLLAIEVMEDLLNFLYELDYKSTKLSGNITGDKSTRS